MTSVGVRVRQAREYCGLTQTEFARRVGVAQPAIAQIEAGSTQPSARVLEAIAFQTRFPISFFRLPEFMNFPLGSLDFRAREAMTAKERKQVHRHGEVIYEGVSRLAERVEMPPIRLPRFERGRFESPAHAAQLTRASLGFSPDAPIQNLINAVERAGVFVLAVPLRSSDAGAYSLWADHRPVIVVFAGVPGDRLRMSVAHELGHLVMHLQLVGDKKQREDEAFAFAGELLLPETAARAELVPPVTLSTLAPLKPRWGMSIAALIVRAARLEIISQRQQRYLFQQLSRRGWRTREPANLDVAIERPRAVRKIAELLYGDPPDHRRLAADLSLPPALVRNILDGSAKLEDLPQVGPIAELGPASVELETEPPPDNVADLTAHRERLRRTPDTLDSA